MISYASVFLDELWGVFTILQLAWFIGYEHIEVQLDNSDVARMMTIPSACSSHISLFRAIDLLYKKKLKLDRCGRHSSSLVVEVSA
ncbi:hypothetical protein V6N13_103285 [Hibiscus sabdariffa]|uniref:RNase H type-1 domain-containing protein n=1 Tax=Hibiscus sabdariffa TaxID=183260 RepID=A0ABR2C559_9ROSI